LYFSNYRKSPIGEDTVPESFSDGSVVQAIGVFPENVIVTSLDGDQKTIVTTRLYITSACAKFLYKYMDVNSVEEKHNAEGGDDR